MLAEAAVVASLASAEELQVLLRRVTQAAEAAAIAGAETGGQLRALLVRLETVE